MPMPILALVPKRIPETRAANKTATCTNTRTNADGQLPYRPERPNPIPDLVRLAAHEHGHYLYPSYPDMLGTPLTQASAFA